MNISTLNESFLYFFKYPLDSDQADLSLSLLKIRDLLYFPLHHVTFILYTLLYILTFYIKLKESFKWFLLNSIVLNLLTSGYNVFYYHFLSSKFDFMDRDVISFWVFYVYFNLLSFFSIFPTTLSRAMLFYFPGYYHLYINTPDETWNDFASSDFCPITDRLGVFVFAGASVNNVNVTAFIDNLPFIVNSWDSMITINANSKDALLTQFFNNISSPSFNLSMADKNLYQDFTWAITQANCECSVFGELIQITEFNTTTNKWQKYADCFQLSGFRGFHDLDNSICFEMGGSTDAAIASTVKENFVKQMVNGWSTVVPFWFIGLHRNAQKKWVWTDYDGSEFPLGNYAPWAPGYNENSPGDCVAVVYQPGVDLSKNYLWVPISCQNQTTGCDDSDTNDCVNAICQARTCDADYLVALELSHHLYHSQDKNG